MPDLLVASDDLVVASWGLLCIVLPVFITFVARLLMSNRCDRSRSCIFLDCIICGRLGLLLIVIGTNRLIELLMALAFEKATLNVILLDF